VKPGEIVAERFEIERLAGSGGMGAVYRVLDHATGEPAAVKVLWGHTLADPDLAERFGREAEVLRELEHPGIVRYIDHGQTPEGEPWLALEWLEGESLSQALRTRSLSVAESVAIGLRVAEALRAAHLRGIVHRDLKPSNLYLVGGTIDGLKVLDFGIAKVTGGAPLTMTGVVIGTPFYMSPEQARGDKTIDARADVFSLGCVLFHCLTGKAPFAGEEMPAALLKVVLEEMPRLSSVRPDIPASLDDLVARMLAKSPRDRPADAAAVALELAALGSFEPGAEGPNSLRPSSLTGRELRLITAVLVRPPAGLTAAIDRGLSPLAEEPLTSQLRADQATGEVAPGIDVDVLLDIVVGRHQGKLATLADGTWIAVLTGTGAATDLVARAARCALALRQALPRASMSLVAGRGAPNAPLPPDDVLARGRRLLDTTAPAPPAGAPRGPRGTAPGEALPQLAPLRVDDVIAGLLGTRFDVGGDAAGLLLRSERDALPAGRTLLGRSTPCVGREHELDILSSLLEQSLSEPTARVVLVTAAPGVGKSRLTSEFLRRVEARRSPNGTPIQVWSAQGDPMSAGSPFGLLAQMIRREAGIREGEPREVRKQKLRARVARHLPLGDVSRVAQFLGELCGVSFSDQESVELRAARTDPMLMGDQIRRAWEDLLDAETAAHALVLVVEDLHWGDLPTVKLLDAALRTLSDRPILVLALGRPDVHEIFPRLWAERSVQEIRLRELSRKGAERLVQEVLGASVEPEVIARIVDRAAGNAFYLEELIRAAADGRSERLPETVLAMVEARLEGLHPEERRLLRAASVFGQTFWRGALPPLLGGATEGREPAGLGQWLADLCDRELLIRKGEGRFPGQEEYAFRHSLLREAAYATLTEADRRLGHRLGARWLEQAGEREATLLAEHFERAGEPERAVQSYRRAAEQALEGNDFQAAVARAERGAAHASGEVLGALRLLQAEAHKWMGSAASAEQAAIEAMSRFPVGSALWYVAAAEAASMRLRLGRHDDLAALAEEVRTRGLARHDLAEAGNAPPPESRLPASRRVAPPCFRPSLQRSRSDAFVPPAAPDHGRRRERRGPPRRLVAARRPARPRRGLDPRARPRGRPHRRARLRRGRPPLRAARLPRPLLRRPGRRAAMDGAEHPELRLHRRPPERLPGPGERRPRHPPARRSPARRAGAAQRAGRRRPDGAAQRERAGAAEPGACAGADGGFGRGPRAGEPGHPRFQRAGEPAAGGAGAGLSGAEPFAGGGAGSGGVGGADGCCQVGADSSVAGFCPRGAGAGAAGAAACGGGARGGAGGDGGAAFASRDGRGGVAAAVGLCGGAGGYREFAGGC
jgi:hypothetical protein